MEGIPLIPTFAKLILTGTFTPPKLVGTLMFKPVTVEVAPTIGAVTPPAVTEVTVIGVPLLLTTKKSNC